MKKTALSCFSIFWLLLFSGFAIGENPILIASYPLQKDGKNNSTVSQPALSLKTDRFKDKSLYCSGIPKTGDLFVPELAEFEKNNFRIGFAFKPSELKEQPLWIVGSQNQFISVYLHKNGLLSIYSNKNKTKVQSKVKYKNNSWQDFQLQYANNKAKVLLNGKTIIEANLTVDESKGGKWDFTTSDVSKKLSYKGFIKNIQFYSVKQDNSNDNGGGGNGGVLTQNGAPEPSNMIGITQRHNYWRAELGLPPLKWSNELAKYAQEWANELARQGCKMEHRPNSGKWAQKYGENIYWSSGLKNTTAAVVDEWASEKKDFNFKTLECNGSWYKCGHYTQIIWENTQRVGCAMAKCGNTEIWVCNYDPPGNYTGQKPYTKK